MELAFFECSTCRIPSIYSISYIILVIVVIRVFFHSLGCTETHSIHVWYIFIYLHLVDSYDECRYIYQSHGSVMGKKDLFLLNFWKNNVSPLKL